MEENQEQQENISPEQRLSILEQRKQRLQSMGLPMPMTPIVPNGVTNVKDPKMLARIQQIRNGNLKNEFQNFENKANGKPDFVEMPVPRPKSNSKQVQEADKPKFKVALEEFTAKSDPTIDGLGNIFDFENTRPKTVADMNKQMTSQEDDGGKGFVSGFKNRLHSKLDEKQQQYTQYSQQNQQQSVPAFQSGMIILNEEDLRKKIIEIAKPIAKQIATEVIKQVLSEYAKKSTSNKPIISEKSNVTKINKFEGELLPDGKVKIGNKVYSLKSS